MKSQAVITGVGLVCPLGQNLEEVTQALTTGNIPYTRTEAYPPGHFEIAAPLPDIDFSSQLGGRGLKYYSQNTLMLSAVSLQALDDAGLTIDAAGSDLSFIAGSAMGNHACSTRYLRMISQAGPHAVMPMDGIDTASNSSVDFAAIRLNARGVVKMVSTGACSSADAIIESAQRIDWGQAHTVAAAGFEKMYPEMIAAFARRGCLGPDNAPARHLGRPYDQQSQGLILGEGAATLILEQRERAEDRHIRVRGRILGYANRFNSNPDIRRAKQTLVNTMVSAIDAAGCDVSEIDWICGSSGGLPSQDRLELLALRDVFGQSAFPPAISSFKAAWGDTFGAAAALTAAAVLGCMERSSIPPMPKLETPRPEAKGLDLVTGIVRKKTLSKVLILAQDMSGFCSALVLGRP